MLFDFDLWAFEDVRRHADAILARVEDGSMPCDRSWSPGETDVYRRWMDAGSPEYVLVKEILVISLRKG